MCEDDHGTINDFGSAAKAAYEASKLRRFACGLPLAAREVDFEPKDISTTPDSDLVNNGEPDARPEES